MKTRDIAEAARRASRSLAGLDRTTKDSILASIAEALENNRDVIFKANREDLAQAEKDNLETPLLKRLGFQEDKLAEVVEGLKALTSLEDPVGRQLDATELDEGLELYKVSCPIGVIGMIFESRPDALVQIAGLSLKSGNAVVLKGGSEASRTNRALFTVISQAAEQAGAPQGWIGLLETRDQITDLLGMDDLIDLLIPRGSNEFVRYIMENSHIPVMGHADGICHIYVHHDADVDQAVKIILDSKTQYVAVCNALETLLVHRDIAPRLLPVLAQALDQAKVEIRGDSNVRHTIPTAKAAVDQDWSTEYLDYILAIKTVDSLDQAIDHINTYGSGHTDAILTQDAQASKRFFAQVDSSSVLWNCSTRFADGFRYGLGAEVGISTGKLHARGPVGLQGLMTYKWQLYGQGQIVGDYSGGGKTYTHRPIEHQKPF